MGKITQNKHQNLNPKVNINTNTKTNIKIYSKSNSDIFTNNFLTINYINYLFLFNNWRTLSTKGTAPSANWRIELLCYDASRL